MNIRQNYCVVVDCIRLLKTADRVVTSDSAMLRIFIQPYLTMCPPSNKHFLGLVGKREYNV